MGEVGSFIIRRDKSAANAVGFDKKCIFRRNIAEFSHIFSSEGKPPDSVDISSRNNNGDDNGDDNRDCGTSKIKNDLNPHNCGNSGNSGNSGNNRVSENDFCNEFSKSFMQYALSIILGRALPDVRDGLKVVHRRILWAMKQLNLTNNSPFRKCAKVVGDVLGKFHPHSDKSVYDALCRLSQSFVQRIPLIEGHGNFGTIDDPPAAMRYTECRLSAECGNVYMGNVENDTVDFIPNFDSSEIEPTVLPSKLPMLLINGTSGIAVGLAASIPCHNPGEILNASIYMARKRGNATLDELLNIVMGPDFPSGGVLDASGELLRQVYETGKGSIQVSALLSFEEKPKNAQQGVLTVSRPQDLHFMPGSKISIIVKQLPFGVHVNEVVMALLKGMQNGVISGVSDIRDETDHTGIRLCLDLKRHVSTAQEIEHIAESMLNNSRLRTFYKCNFVALAQRNQSLVPVRLSLLSALRYWLEFRVETIKRGVIFFYKKAQHRQSVIEGMIKVVNNVENVVKMIRSSTTSAEIIKSLARPEFGSLSKVQASAVMKLTLFQLTRLHSDGLVKENEKLTADLLNYERILANPEAIYDMIVEELEALKSRNKQLFSLDSRKTLIRGDSDAAYKVIPIGPGHSRQERMILSLDLHTGTLHKLKIPASIAKPRSHSNISSSSSSSANVNAANTTTLFNTLFECLKMGEQILLISNTGVAYTIPDSKINFSSKGTGLAKLIPGMSGQIISSISCISSHSPDPEANLYIINQDGWLRVADNGLLLGAPVKKGVKRARLFRAKAEDDRLISLQSKCDGESYLLLGTRKGFVIKLSLESLKDCKKTSKLISLREGDKVSCACIAKNSDPLLLLSSTSHMKIINVGGIRLQSRKGRGVNSHSVGEGHLVFMQPVSSPQSDLLIITKNSLSRKKFSMKEKLARHKPTRIRAFNDESGPIYFSALV